MNVVTRASGRGRGRAAARRRGGRRRRPARARRPAARRDVDLARGPARLCAALGIDKSAYGRWLLGDGPVRLRPADVPVPGEAVAAGPARRRHRRARRAVAVLDRRRPDGQRLPPARAA